ncbi:MAG: glycosyltransferase [Desulfobacteraceae bacterium]
MIQTHNIHAVHTNTILVHSGAIAARITGKKVIWHIRERITEPRAVMYYIFNLIRWMSHRIICISQNVKENMESFTGVLERAEVIYNGVDLSVFSPSPVSRDRGARLKKSFTIPDDHYVVGIVGRVAFWKGHDTFVKAAKRVLDQGHQVIFLVAGDLDREINQRYYDSLFSYIDQHHLSKNFIFTGFIADVAAVYAALDIAVVPSTRPEPFGLVAIEALAMGKPVIATNHGGTAEIIADTGFGALIPPGDHKALAANIISYINSESHMKRVKTLAPIYIKDNFAIGSCVNRIQLVYNKIHGINWK